MTGSMANRTMERSVSKSISAVIRKKMKRREELMREVSQIDVELEALQAAERSIGGLQALRQAISR